MKKYSFLQEGIGLTNACCELKDADPQLLAAIGPNVLKQYGKNNKLTIEIQFSPTKDNSFLIDSFIVNCQKKDKITAKNLINAIKYHAIPDKELEGEYNPPRSIRIRYKFTDDYDSDEKEDVTLY